MEFTKLHTNGNDFIFLEQEIDGGKIRQICNRHFGIGCDQLLVIKNNKEISVKIYNQDGSIAKMCGNAMIAIADKYLENNSEKIVNINSNLEVKIKKINNQSSLILPLPIIENNLVNTGNLHQINIIQHKNEIDYSQSSEFNKNYVNILNDDTFFLTTIERGVGETLACGSGICASAFYLHINQHFPQNINVITKGSQLTNNPITIELNKDNIILKTKSTKIFTGLLPL